MTTDPNTPAPEPTEPPGEIAADWRTELLDRVRGLIRQVDPDIEEEAKWRKPTNPDGVPTWSRAGIICTGETYRDKVKLTFARGASLADPGHLFNASLEGGTRRAIDFYRKHTLPEGHFKALVAEAVAWNVKHARKRPPKADR